MEFRRIEHMKDWRIFTGDGVPSDRIANLPGPPSWRRFDTAPEEVALAPLLDDKAIMMTNAALVLRRPLLVTGPPGSGKSTLAKLVARELSLGPVLRWPITTASRLQDGLYEYDAIGRVHDENHRNGHETPATFDVGRYIRLGPLGTALLASDRPRVLLIDEIDKSDIDLPSNLLHVFEEGEFTVRELERLPDADDGIAVRTADNESALVHNGVVRCTQFPFVLLTSNGERTFPRAFLRRCLSLELRPPTDEQMKAILDARIGGDPGGPDGPRRIAQRIAELMEEFTQGPGARRSAVGGQRPTAQRGVRRPLLPVPR
jgi:MoxR-like ATPase